MKQSEVRTQRNVSVPSLRRVGGIVLWLGLVTVINAGARWFYNVHDQPVRPLTVRPRAMATATRNALAGDQLLDSFPGMPPRPPRTPGELAPPTFSVYVPEQCVGAHRCPLLVNVYAGGEWHPMADKYGLIILFISNGLISSAPSDTGSKLLDAALQQTLRQFAIDPDKIVMSGTCGTGAAAFFWGRMNLHVFSRVVAISPQHDFGDVTTPPLNKKSQILLTAGVDEQAGSERDPYLNDYLRHSMKFARQARRDGLQVTGVLGLRNHPGKAVDYDLVGRWLHESWTKPARPRPVPVVVADPLPVLTPEALGHFTTFWTRFMQEPDSIRVIARLAHLRPVFVPIGTVQRVTWMSDLVALAKRSPAVAADLRAAGLTASQADAYRVALVSAKATLGAGEEAGPIAANSVMGQNGAFFKAHRSDFKALDEEATSMWRTP